MKEPVQHGASVAPPSFAAAGFGLSRGEAEHDRRDRRRVALGLAVFMATAGRAAGILAVPRGQPAVLCFLGNCWRNCLLGTPAAPPGCPFHGMSASLDILARVACCSALRGRPRAVGTRPSSVGGSIVEGSPAIGTTASLNNRARHRGPAGCGRAAGHSAFLGAAITATSVGSRRV